MRSLHDRTTGHGVARVRIALLPRLMPCVFHHGQVVVAVDLTWRASLSVASGILAITLGVPSGEKGTTNACSARLTSPLSIQESGDVPIFLNELISICKLLGHRGARGALVVPHIDRPSVIDR